MVILADSNKTETASIRGESFTLLMSNMITMIFTANNSQSLFSMISFTDEKDQQSTFVDVIDYRKAQIGLEYLAAVLH